MIRSQTKKIIIFVILILILILLSYNLYKIFYYSTEDKNKLKNYLKWVYPLLDVENTSISKLDSLYNNLGFYYNPCSEYTGSDLTTIYSNGKPLFGTTWSSLDICDKVRLPYIPKGYFLSFNHYNKTNQPVIEVTKKMYNIEDWTSFRQTLHWGFSKDGGEISRSARSGPGTYWLTNFSLIRDFYYPNGIYFDTKSKTWSIKCNMSSNLPNHNCKWLSDTRWTYGFKQGEYIEITHSENSPGMPQSNGYWFNGLPGGGSGVFLEIGKTFVANNKVDTVLKLFQQLLSKSVSELSSSMKDTKYNGMSGKEILEKVYPPTPNNPEQNVYDDNGNINAHLITWMYLNGKAEALAFTSTGGNSVVPTSAGFSKVGNKGILGASGLMVGGRETFIGLKRKDGFGYAPNGLTSFEDLAKWWITAKKDNSITTFDPNLKLTIQDKIDVVNAAANPVQDIDYFPNRAGGMVPPDEPISWLSFILEYETIQMPMSANDNGSWVYEIIDYRLPNSKNTPGFPPQKDDWLNSAKERVYKYFKGDVSDGSLSWDSDAIGYWNKHLEKFLSYRNPLNLSEGKNCENIAYIPNSNTEQCKNPWPNVQDVPGEDTSGFIWNNSDKCWVAVKGRGWRNIPCINNSLNNQYLKLPHNYPGNTTDILKTARTFNPFGYI